MNAESGIDCKMCSIQKNIASLEMSFLCNLYFSSFFVYCLWTISTLCFKNKLLFLYHRFGIKPRARFGKLSEAHDVPTSNQKNDTGDPQTWNRKQTASAIKKSGFDIIRRNLCCCWERKCKDYQFSRSESITFLIWVGDAPKCSNIDASSGHTTISGFPENLAKKQSRLEKLKGLFWEWESCCKTLAKLNRCV